MRAYQALASAAALSLVLAMSGAAYAATNDDMSNTSGPAAGSNVKPGHKQKMAHNSKVKSNEVSGAPGVEGAKGSKSGPAEK